MGWWGNNAKNRVSRTRSRCSLKEWRPLQSQACNFWLLSLQTSPSQPIPLPPSSSSQLPHPHNFLILPDFAPRTARSVTSSHPDRGSSSLSLSSHCHAHYHVSTSEVSPLPLLSGTAASSRSDFSHFPPQYAAMYVQKRGKSALPIASRPPASNPTQMDARSAYSSTRSQLVFRDCAMGSIWTTSIPWQSLKR